MTSALLSRGLLVFSRGSTNGLHIQGLLKTLKLCGRATISAIIGKIAHAIIVYMGTIIRNGQLSIYRELVGIMTDGSKSVVRV